MKRKPAKRAAAPKKKPAKKKPAKKKPTKKPTWKKAKPAKKKPAKKLAPKPSTQSQVEAAMRGLLASLDSINDQNSGLTDTDVREILAHIVIERLVQKNPTPIPDDFQMMEDAEMSPAQDQLVKRAITDFITAVEAAAEWQSCATVDERKALIARDDVTSNRGNAYWLYLGDWS